VPDLVGAEGLLPVLTVPELDAALLEQGDRPAAGASGAGTDQLEHGWKGMVWRTG
jgi:hypothetical protein